MTEKVQLLQRAKELILKVLAVMKNHKKKLICLAVVPLLIYIIKKNMTLNHVIIILTKISSLLQYLPLPASIRHRPLPKYDHYRIGALHGIIAAMDVDNIRAKIVRKEATWDHLKRSILSGAVVTIVLYDIRTFFLNVQNKYSLDFETLGASTQFEQAIEEIQSNFLREIPHFKDQIQDILAVELAKIDIQNAYNIDSFEQMLQDLVNKVFEAKFELKKQYSRAKQPKLIPNRSTQIAENLFYSTEELVLEDKNKKSPSFIGRFFHKSYQIIKKVLAIDIFPELKEEITNQRYAFIRTIYQQNFKKNVHSVQWPNHQSKYLSILVLQQIQFMISSLNYHTLLNSYAQFNTQMLANRFRIFMKVSKKDQIQLSHLLPSLYKIIKEQFLNINSYDQRESFHKKQLRSAIELKTLHEQKHQIRESEQELKNIFSFLQQIQAKNALEYLQKQFELKYFNERSKIMINPTTTSHKNEPEELKELMNLFSNSKGLNSED